jgi:hypothetical protein
MDELTLVRELRPEAEPMRPEVRRKARAALRFEIGYATEQAARRRPRRLAAAFAACALAFGAGAVAIVDEQADPPRLAGTDREPALGTGIPRGDQFLYTREVLFETPVDGGEPERFVDESWQSVSGFARSRDSERGRSWTRGPGEVYPPRSYEKLAELPTEPRALYQALLGYPSEPGPYDDETAYAYLMMLLRDWSVMPPGLRTAAFEAVTAIPGVKVIPGDSDARGRPGIGITRPGDPLGWHIVVDRRTYEYLGFRDTFVRDEDGVKVTRVSALVAHWVVDRIGQRP